MRQIGMRTTQRRLALKRSPAAMGVSPERVLTKSRIWIGLCQPPKVHSRTAIRTTRRRANTGREIPLKGLLE